MSKALKNKVKLNDVVSVKDFGAVGDGVADDTVEIQAAVTSAAAANKTLIFPSGTYLISASINMATNLRIKVQDRAILKSTTNSISLLTDNNVALTDVVIDGLRFESPSGGTNRAIIFDVDTASRSERIVLRNLYGTGMYRLIELDRANDVVIENVCGESLGNVVIYIGESVGTGRSSNVRIVGTYGLNNGGAASEGGIIASYVDGLRISESTFVDCGATSGALNLYHSIYARACTNVVITDFTISGQKRGAGVHVYSDTGAGEAPCKNISISNGSIRDTANYTAVRISGFVGLSISNVQCDTAYEQCFRIDNGTDLSVSGCFARNGNQIGSSGTLAASAFDVSEVSRFTISSCLAVEDSVVGGEYGQGVFVSLSGTCANGSVSNNVLRFATGIGYDFAAVQSGGTSTDVTFNGNRQDGASGLITESGTGTRLSFIDNHLVNNSNSAIFTDTQLHKWVIRANYTQGASYRTESDGANVIARRTSVPSSGAWTAGDIVWRTTPSAGFTPGYVCVTTGSPGTWKEMAALSA